MPKDRNNLSRSAPLAEIRRKVLEAVRARGYESVSQACRRLDYSYVSLQRILREGLPANPRVRTVEVLRDMGVLGLVKHRTSSSAPI